MVEAIVSAVADKLSSYLLQEPSLLYGVQEEVDWLERELRQMLCFLPDAVAKKENCELVTKWVRDVRDITFDIEDAVETFMLEADILTHRGSFKLMFIKCDPTAASERLLLMVASCFPIFGSIVTHRWAGREIIQNLETKIVEISKRKVALGIISLDETGGAGSTSESKILHGSNSIPHLYDGCDIVGFKEDQRKIVELLNNGNILRVIPIIGLKGHGKTTFAKNIYDDEEITDNFEVSYWLSVSQNDTLSELLVKIIREVGGKVRMGNLVVEVLKEMLCKILSSQGQYLIVMDDFSNKEVWDVIKTAFPDTGNGSRVIFTTQDVEFARSSDHVITHHELSFLNHAESMELFHKKLYQSQKVEALPKNLEHLGQKLVEKCEGLPMSIVLLGSLLSVIEKTHHQWLKVLNSLDREPTKNDSYSSILAICYAALPCHLKSCFLYTCSFPEDSEIPARRLMRLWIAEGFVRPRLGKTTTEMAEAFLEELAARSMVKVASRRWDGTIKAIQIHIFLHHFCQAEARNCKFLHFVDSLKVKRARRLALHTSEPESYIDDSRKKWRTPKLRTLILGSSTDELSLCGLRLLRVIDVEVADSSVQLPLEIASLIHLRYLRWRAFVDFQRIKTLCSLQTLHVQFGIKNVDGSIGNFRALRFLSNLKAGMWIESGLSKLTDLEKLGLEKIRDQEWKGLIKSLSKLQRLASLMLSPCYSGKIPAQAISIFSSQHSLRRLKLFGTLLDKQLPHSSSFPPNLTKLVLLFSELESDPMPILKELPNLTSLELLEGAYEGNRMHCQGGGFPRLQYLKVHCLHKLKYWKLDDGALPSLTHLCISYCNLKKLPKGLEHVTTLEDLILAPAEFKRRILEEQGIIDGNSRGAASKLMFLDFLRQEIMTLFIDKSFGFDTAVEEAQRAINVAHVEATTVENGTGVVKLMAMGQFSDLVENEGAAKIEVGKEDELSLSKRKEEELERMVQMVLAIKEAPSSSQSSSTH